MHIEDSEHFLVRGLLFIYITNKITSLVSLY
jgi:hypothetical protein